MVCCVSKGCLHLRTINGLFFPIAMAISKLTYVEGYPLNKGETLTYSTGVITHKHDPATVPPYFEAKSIRPIISYDIWHKRLGHPSKEVFRHFPSQTKGFEKYNLPTPSPIRCEGCLK